ncbi:MAG: winged helix-turn-helix domain-containing protein [Tannerella sp.]|jgi:hypothetical protein|nr:winged helix-turn-helix domain-containing protein [Tannerella sp.]
MRSIGLSAGVIWELLFEKGSLTLSELEELTGLKQSLILLAFGWLAREDKISFSEMDGSLKVKLKSLPTETYY